MIQPKFSLSTSSVVQYLRVAFKRSVTQKLNLTLMYVVFVVFCAVPSMILILNYIYIYTYIHGCIYGMDKPVCRAVQVLSASQNFPGNACCCTKC